MGNVEREGPPPRQSPAKYYELHEGEYRRMRCNGVTSWNERSGLPPIEPNEERFLCDVLAQLWAPRGGRALELGCGTAPILRWLHGRGFRGTGLDISATAIRMARAQSRGLRLALRVGDVTDLPEFPAGRFDLVVDGRCLHCLVDPADRAAMLSEAARILRPGGVFVLLTMCAPVDRRRLIKAHGGRMRGAMMLMPADNAAAIRGAAKIGRKWHVPVRRFDPWPKILRDLRAHGLSPRLIRVALPTEDEPLSALAVATVKD